MKSVISGRTFLECKGKFCETEQWDRKIMANQEFARTNSKYPIINE